MSLKNIEMQIAVPRTQDAGKMQSELMDRGYVINSQAAEAAQKEEERKRTAVVHKDDLQKAQFHKEGTRAEYVNNEKERKDNKTEDPPAKHPYKGNFIDFSG